MVLLDLLQEDRQHDPPRKKPDVPVLALTVDQAVESLGLGREVFRRDVLPRVRSIKVGRTRIVPVIELSVGCT